MVESQGAVREDDSATRRIGRDQLLKHGIWCSANIPLRAQEKKVGSTLLLCIDGDAPADVAVKARAAHPNHIAVLFVTARGVKRQPWREIENHYLLIAPTEAAPTMRCWGRWNLTGLLIPRAALTSAELLPPGRARMGTGRRQLEHATHAFIASLLTADTSPSPDEYHAIERLLAGMSNAVLLDRLSGAASDRREMLRRRAAAVISQQCSDPSLNPTRVARDVGTSLRTLQAVFSEAGTTVAADIRSHRVRLALSLLSNHALSALPINQVAVRAGFRTAMSLRRAVLQEHGATPSVLRHHHAGSQVSSLTAIARGAVVSDRRAEHKYVAEAHENATESSHLMEPGVPLPTGSG